MGYQIIGSLKILLNADAFVARKGKDGFERCQINLLPC